MGKHAASSSPAHKPYDIFISYRQIDSKDTALALYAMLTQRFRLKVFLDAQELDNLHDLAELVCKSRCVLPIISAGYLETLLDAKSWCSLEIITALQHNIPLVPVYDPEKTGIPGQNYTAKLDPAISPLFRILFKAIRREGEYLDVFFKDLLRSAGQEEAWIRSTGNPWESLDCSPRTRYMLQVSSVRYDVASTLIKQLGLADIDDFKLLTDSMIASVGLKPLEQAKVTELVRGIKAGDWAEVTDQDVLEGLYDMPSDVRSEAGGGSSMTSVTGGGRMRQAALTVAAAQRMGALSLRGGSGLSPAPSLRSANSLTSPFRPASARGGLSPLQSHPSQRTSPQGSKTLMGTCDQSVADSTATDATIVAALGMQRVVSGDLAELASILSKAKKPLTLDLANRTFSSASWRGVLSLHMNGTCLSGGTLVLRRGQKVVMCGQDVLLEDVVIHAARPSGGASVHSHGVDSDGSTDVEDSEGESESESEEESEEESESESEEEGVTEDEETEGEEEEEEEEDGVGAESEGHNESESVGTCSHGRVGSTDALVEVVGSGVGTLRRVTLVAHGKRCAALDIMQGGTLTALDCVASNTGGSSHQHVAVVSGTGSTLHAEECQFRNCYGSILVVEGGGCVRLQGCSVSRSKRRGGVEVHGHGSQLSADTSQVFKTRNACVAAHDGAQLHLDSCALHDSITSSGLVVCGKSTTVTTHNTAFKDNSQAGAYVTDGAVLRVTGCTFSGNGQHSCEAEGYDTHLHHDLRCKWGKPPSTSEGALIHLIT